MELDVVNLINNVGFPIAISIALFYHLVKTSEIVREFQATIIQNTETIERLVESIETIKRSVIDDV